MRSSDHGWTRVATEEAFRLAFADRLLSGDGVRFTIHGDGRISGWIGDRTLTGAWFWRDGFFCRTARLDGEDLPLDCEIIERNGAQMRYTRNMGRGAATVVALV